MIEREDLSLRRVSYDYQMRRGFKPRLDCQPWPYSLPIDWSADPFNDQNWVFQLQSWRLMDAVIAEFYNTRENRYLDECMEIARDWQRAEREKDRPHQWGDMATGMRATRLAFLYERVNEDGKRMLGDLVDAHARKLMEEGFFSLTNHGLFQAAGLKLLAKVAGDRPTLRDADAVADRQMLDLLHDQFTDEGVHREHSPAYHLFVLEMMRKLRIARHFPAPEIAGIIERAEAIAPWLVFPDRTIARVGDTEGEGEPYTGPETIGDFTASGYAVARGSDWMLFVTGMSNSIMHKHADELSFELFDGGRFIFSEAGKFGYSGMVPMRVYALSGAAHNTVSIVERDVRRNDVEMLGSCLTGIRQDGDAFVVTGDVVRPRLFRQQREIRYRPGKEIVIRDDVSSERLLTYVSSLHLAPDLMPEIAGNTFRVDLGDGRVMRGETDADELRVARGEEEPLRGWTTESYLKMVPCSTLMAIAQGRSRSINWNISFE